MLTPLPPMPGPSLLPLAAQAKHLAALKMQAIRLANQAQPLLALSALIQEQMALNREILKLADEAISEKYRPAENESHPDSGK